MQQAATRDLLQGFMFKKKRKRKERKVNHACSFILLQYVLYSIWSAWNTLLGPHSVHSPPVDEPCFKFLPNLFSCRFIVSQKMGQYNKKSFLSLSFYDGFVVSKQTLNHGTSLVYFELGRLSSSRLVKNFFVIIPVTQRHEWRCFVR